MEIMKGSVHCTVYTQNRCIKWNQMFQCYKAMHFWIVNSRRKSTCGNRIWMNCYCWCIIVLLRIPYEFAACGAVDYTIKQAFYFHLNVSIEMESGKYSYFHFQRKTKTHSSETAIECRWNALWFWWFAAIAKCKLHNVQAVKHKSRISKSI